MKRKNILLGLALLLAFPSWSQSGDLRKREVSSIELQSSILNYNSDAHYWSGQVALQPTDEAAWINWYKAERYAAFSSKSRELSNSESEKLATILSSMEAAVPNSFALHYATFLQSKRSDPDFAALDKAYALQPNDAEILLHKFGQAHVLSNTAEAREFAQKTATLFSPSEKSYAKNMLLSTGNQGLLITNGTKDTYPVLNEQLHGAGNASAVQVFSTEFLGNAAYRLRFANSAGLSTAPTWNGDTESFVRQVLQKSSQPTYLSLTLPPSLLKSLRKDLYLKGNVLQYAPDTKPNNISETAALWEQMDLQYLSNYGINRNYLPMLQALSSYFEDRDQEKWSLVDAQLSYFR